MQLLLQPPPALGSTSRPPTCFFGQSCPDTRHCSVRWAARPSHSRDRTLDAGSRGPVLVRAYSEPSNTDAIGKFFKNLQGSLPIIGLVSRLVSDEGGIGTDRVRYGEFCTRVEKSLSSEAKDAFNALQARHGKMARKAAVLMWCWAPAVGAGLVKSEDILLGARRMRYSNDVEYELERLDSIMEEALKTRAKAKGTYPDIPMAGRAQKALEAVCACSIGSATIDPQDAPTLTTIFSTVFPGVDKEEMAAVVQSRVKREDPEEEAKTSSSVEGLESGVSAVTGEQASS